MKLHHGDCLEIMQRLAARSVDLILTDLPYGSTDCDWDSVIDLPRMWLQCNRVLKKKSAFVTTCRQPFASYLVISNIKHFKYEIIWDQITTTGFLNAKKMPLVRHQNIMVFSKSSPTYNPRMTPRTIEELKAVRKKPYIVNHRADGVYQKKKIMVPGRDSCKDKHPMSIVAMSSRKGESNRGLHPTQKPVLLMEYLLLTYSNPGDIVLDICMGSGTTGEACRKHGREFIGIEKKLEYYNISVERLIGAGNAKSYL